MKGEKTIIKIITKVDLLQMVCYNIAKGELYYGNMERRSWF